MPDPVPSPKELHCRVLLHSKQKTSGSLKTSIAASHLQRGMWGRMSQGNDWAQHIIRLGLGWSCFFHRHFFVNPFQHNRLGDSIVAIINFFSGHPVAKSTKVSQLKIRCYKSWFWFLALANLKKIEMHWSSQTMAAFHAEVWCVYLRVTHINCTTRYHTFCFMDDILLKVKVWERINKFFVVAVKNFTDYF